MLRQQKLNQNKEMYYKHPNFEDKNNIVSLLEQKPAESACKRCEREKIVAGTDRSAGNANIMPIPLNEQKGIGTLVAHKAPLVENINVRARVRDRIRIMGQFSISRRIHENTPLRANCKLIASKDSRTHYSSLSYPKHTTFDLFSFSLHKC